MRRFRKLRALIDYHLGPLGIWSPDRAVDEQRHAGMSTRDLVLVWLNHLDAPVLPSIQPPQLVRHVVAARLILYQ